MNKIFGYAITRNGEQLAVAIAKDGKTIALVPSAPEQAAFALGMMEGSTQQHDKYNAYFRGEEWSAEFVDTAQAEGHLGLQRAFKKAAKQYDDAFEATKAKLAAKDPNQANRKKARFGIMMTDVADE